jgi:multiple sugar transport system substrate-binding protein
LKQKKGEDKMASKKVLIILLSFVLVLLSACSGGEKSSSDSDGQKSSQKSSSDKVEVVFWNMFGGADGRVMEGIIKQFNEEHDDIHVEGMTQDWGEFYTILSTAVLGNSAPDLAISHSTRLNMLVGEGIIQPMDNEISVLNWNDFVESGVEGVTVDDQIYGVPLDFHSHILAYNKDILGGLNLLNNQGEPEIQNYDDFVSILTKVKESEGDYIPFTFPQKGGDPLRLWWALYNQLGGSSFISSDLSSSELNKEAALGAFTALTNLYDKSLIPPNIDNYNEHFLNGKAAINILGVWNVNNFIENMEDDFGFMEMPKFFDSPGTWADSHSFILPTIDNRDDKKTKAAMTFVSWVIDNNHMWAAAGHLPTTHAGLNSDKFKELPLREGYADSADFMKIIPGTKELSFAWSPRFTEILDEVWSGIISEEEGVKKVESLINEQVQ